MPLRSSGVRALRVPAQHQARGGSAALVPRARRWEEPRQGSGCCQVCIQTARWQLLLCHFALGKCEFFLIEKKTEKNEAFFKPQYILIF